MADNKNSQALQQSSAAWSDSVLYSGMDFPRYNPDDLLVRRGHSIYKKMMMDEQLKAVTRFRRDAVSGREWGFKFDNDVELSDDEKARRIAIFNKAVLNMRGSFKDKLNIILTSMHNGFSVSEPLYELFKFKGAQYWGIRNIVKKPFESFHFVTDEYGELKELYQFIDGVKQVLNINNLIHHVHNPDVDPYYGQSELREAYRAWFSKENIIKFFNIHLERHASGFLAVFEKEENSMPMTGTPEHTSLINLVNNFQVKTGILLPRGLEAKLESPNKTDAFEKAIQLYDKALAKALLMPNLMGFSEDSGVGSQARAQTQLESFLWILDAEAGSLEETLNEQVFRGLGEANFIDGLFPRFTFRPLSKAMMQTIVTTWADLVDKNAVVPSRDDEDHVRNLMDFPPKPPIEDDDEDNVSVDANTALNGAQVSSMVGIVEKVSQGLIPWTTGVSLLVNSFPINVKQAEELLNDVPKDLYDPDKVEDTNDKGGGNVPEDNGNIDKVNTDPNASGKDNGNDQGNDTKDKGDTSKSKKQGEEESLLRSNTKHVDVDSFTAMERRVNFSEIDRSSQVILHEGVNKLTATINDMTKFFINVIEKDELYGADTDPSKVDDLTVPASFNKRLQKESSTMLKDSWELGVMQAKQEIEKAGNKFTRRQKLKEFTAQFGSITDVAVAYFDSRSFAMAGKLSEGTLDVIKQEILNGIKYSKGFKDVKRSIYESLAKFGVLDIDDVEEALDQALEITNSSARIETTVRTSTFEAINEARFSYFTDKSLDGFVKALQYTAILDSRTTDICTDMDGRTYPLNSDEWSKYRPPNHFNCRSLLIPLIEGDKFKVTRKAHKYEPATGFM